MPTTITIDPVTRIEGHLEIEVTVDSVGGEQKVVDAKSAGTMFRGFEIILAGRDPRDAAQYTQRICGVCPVSHAMASCLNLDDAFGVTSPDNGRILRNLVLGSNFIQSHILHFYHLSVLDYVDTTGLLDMSPWTPRYVTPDMTTGPTAAALVSNYVTALALRRKAHQMGAIFGGKLPCTGSFVVGGCTEVVTAEKIADFRTLLTEIRAFIDNTYVPDAATLAGLFPSYYGIGTGCGNLLAFGAFDLDATGANMLFNRGRYTDGASHSVDPAQITEYVQYGWYTPASGNKNPAQGVTEPDADKLGAYSWLKAPRYADKVHETGPLARMWVNGEYVNGISTLDRIVARANETKLIADTMDSWLDELTPGAATCAPSTIPQQAASMGLTEAPRGALGHWMNIDGSVITRYQVVTPTNWNASPKDDLDQMGPIEAALLDVPVVDVTKPVEVLRVVHSFDPCLACAVHLTRPDDRAGGTRVLIHPGIL
ncbi:MAG: nickel-dependent hydrogenase large subunit [Phycisphaerales bacterium]|nr:MAG: nickel-dependent hydrogenase large subunit [Phycisphaerales bacterium]